MSEQQHLQTAEQSLGLHWLKNYPGYRKMLRERVAKEAIRAERYSQRIDKYYEEVDYLGREVEGCG